MSLGSILLLALGLLLIFGVLQRVLDRMRLSDRAAIIFTAAIFLGSLVPDIPLGGEFYVNLGGAVLPVAMCVYLFIKCDTAGERWRSILAAVIGAAIVYLTGKLLPAEPEEMPFDINILYGLLAGLAAYLLGRSRRAAFIAGVMGVLLADIFQGVLNRLYNVQTAVRLGGGGALDAMVISGILAVALAEIIGEIRERSQGGTKHRSKEYHAGEFVPVREGRQKERK